MNDNELERWAEQQEEARDVRGGMVLVVYLQAAALLGALLLLAGAMASAGVVP